MILCCGSFTHAKVAFFLLAGLTGGAYVDGFEITDEGFPTYTDLETSG